MEEEGSVAYCVKADIGRRDEAFAAVGDLAEKLGGVDILVNNAAQQYEETDLRKISEEQLRPHLRQQREGYFFVTQAALEHLPNGGAIVNTASVTAFKGQRSPRRLRPPRGARIHRLFPVDGHAARRPRHPRQLRGARPRLDAADPRFVRRRACRTVRNPRADGPSGPALGSGDVLTSFLASDDGNYFAGQTLHPNGGVIVGG